MKNFLLISLSFLLSSYMAEAQTAQLFGTTQSGGTANEGTIFKMNADGTGFTTVFSFAEPEGWHPMGNLVEAGNGKLYGTCYEGGDFYSCTIYCYDPERDTCFDVYDFDITHGDFPQSGMIVAPDGTLWGVASAGGIDSVNNIFGIGVIYSFNPFSNLYTQEYIFADSAEWYPLGTPILAGYKLYGMSNGGSPLLGTGSYGSIYSFDIITKSHSRLFEFDSITGGMPEGSFIQLNDGKFYGMTSIGGANNKGTIFSYDPSNNTFQKLFDFDGNRGATPRGSLLYASNGKLYGATSLGGSYGGGVIFSLDISNNIYSVLHNFNGSGGSIPLGSLGQYGTDKLYGSASAEGIHGYGVLFTYDISNNSYQVLVQLDGSNGSEPNGCVIAVNTTSTVSNFSEDEEQLIVLPNPATTKLSIRTGSPSPAEVSIYTAEGKLADLPRQISDGAMDISSLPKGAYIAQVKINGVVRQVKWLKM